MPDIANLTNAIIGEAKRQADEIIAAAQTRAKETLSAEAKRGSAEGEAILRAADAKAKRAAERLISAQKSKSRDDVLGEKQAIIGRVIDTTLKRLNAIGGKEYRDFVLSGIYRSAFIKEGGCEILLMDGRGISVNDVNVFLKENGLPSVAAYGGEAHIDGGFAIFKNGVAERFDFAALISSTRDSLQAIAAAALFTEGAL